MPNPDRPWPRPESPRAPLDPTTSETLELWAAQPEWDMRSLEEFAADGGRPMFPPNRTEGGPPVWAAFFAFVWGLPYLLFRFFRRLTAPSDRGRFYELPPPIPRFVPAPPPPSTPMTGHLRASFDWAALGIPGGHGGDGRVVVGTYRGQPFDELAIDSHGNPVPVDAGGALVFPFPRNPAPTTSMLPRAPIGGTGETRRRADTDSTGAR